MCSNEEDGCGNLALPEKLSIRIDTTCRSCTKQPIVLLRKKDAYCRDCFLASETHKFRAALGKTKLMKPQDNVLVACSGSQSSMALLHLLQSGVTEKHHKKLLFNVNVLYIEEGALFMSNTDERIHLVNKVKQMVQCYGFPTYITTISECFNESPHIDTDLKTNSDNDKQLMSFFNSLKSITSKEDLLSVLRKKLISSVAVELKCNKIFTAEVGNNLAVKLLSNFALGRGEKASFETGFCDTHLPHCMTLRPLRDFLRKEIVYYNRLHNVDSISGSTFITKSQNNASIQKLTEKFVTDLQEDFPSTVYTIFRTGEKLSSFADDENKKLFCLLCGDRFKTKMSNDYSAVDALNMSLSVLKGNNIAGVGSNDMIKVGNTENCRENLFCFGCGGIINDLESLNSLPRNMLQSAMENKNMEQIQEQISEFLISDS